MEFKEELKKYQNIIELELKKYIRTQNVPESKLNESNISYYISKAPTKYLCNAAYYHMLKKNPNTVFIHIPSLKGMNETLMNKLADIF